MVNKIVFTKPNKKILSTKNYIFYKIGLFIYKILSLFIDKFQKNCLQIYTVWFQTNRLSFNIFPDIVKYILIHLATLGLWEKFFRRIKNFYNLYVIREKKYVSNNFFWMLYYREYNKYYYELNVNRRESPEISNFFYKTRICPKKPKIDKTKIDYSKKTEHDVPKKLNKKICYKTIMFYFFNKIILNNYPYFYWTYDLTYNKYGLRPTSVKTSHHIRSHLLFLFVQLIKVFFKKKKKISFIKLSFTSFKGIYGVFYSSFAKKFSKFVKKRKLLKRTDVLVFENATTTLYKNIISEVATFYDYKKLNIFNFKINNIVYINHVKTKKLISFMETFQKKIIMQLPITWFNKIYNAKILKKKNDIILYIRASKHFNKGRYSRNRQLYRTGVYWCLWLNVLIVYGLYFYFYRFTFSFGYFWLPMGLLILSMFGSRLYKYRYYNFNQIQIEFYEYSEFLFYFFLKLKNQTLSIYNKYKYNIISKIVKVFKKYISRLILFVIYRFKRVFFFNKFKAPVKIQKDTKK